MAIASFYLRTSNRYIITQITKMITQLDDIDWYNWTPEQRATLLFVVRDGKILLIRKKRGFGKGKINGPGGKIEINETPLHAAIRETQEELLVIPTNVKEAGFLRFQFLNNFSMSVSVFIAGGCIGDVQETDEAIPIWTPISSIPYNEMWPDDIHWIPSMLSKQYFRGRFLLDNDILLGFALKANKNGK